ncbi:MAG TPA: methyltransferase domain-containing protein [Thermoanaerobaculia bacterium]|jgi:uncharacterized protein YbaR (Trm112 family)|nr:methyltransferase domain-containing protein [Thermoanaerobaculia bacterium]
MNRDLLEVLACPECRGDLDVRSDAEHDGRVETGSLVCRRCDRAFPIVRHVPRFVPGESYANSFGFQWTRFRETQLDSHSGLPISKDRFLQESQWSPAELRGKRVLDIGCGAGRFAEVAAGTGAKVLAIDYSSAVDACYANLASYPQLDVAQANVYELPIKPGSFDYVYCFGVLQHTPDPHAAVLALADPLKTGGKLALDFYPRLLANLLWPKYWLRPLTRRMNQERLFRVVQRLVNLLLPVSKALAAVPLFGRRLRYLLPIITYYGVFSLTDQQHREWAVLDTFDMLAPAHDHPQTSATVRRWLTEAGLREIETPPQRPVVGRAVK